MLTDRERCVAGRVIDLSAAAAEELGMVEQGVKPVLIEAEPQQLAYAARTRTRTGSGC